MKRRLLVILLSCIFVTSSFTLTACTDTHTAAEVEESEDSEDIGEPQDEVESIQESVDEAEENESADDVMEDDDSETADGSAVTDEVSATAEVAEAPAEERVVEESPSSELVCTQCNRVVDYISRYGICDDCYSANNNFGNCSYCGVALTSAEVSSAPTNRCFNCKDICIMCGTQGVDQSQIMEYGDVICGNCWMMYCTPCENCGKIGNLTWSGDGRILCPNCIAALGQ